MRTQSVEIIHVATYTIYIYIHIHIHTQNCNIPIYPCFFASVGNGPGYGGGATIHDRALSEPKLGAVVFGTATNERRR